MLGPGIGVFGDGPDGGREAAFEGPMRFPEPGKPWDGYGVVQAKFKQRLAGDSKDAAWLLGQVRAELERWADPRSERVRHGRPPRYVLFTTNVVLSAVAGSGGIDRVDALIAGYAERRGCGVGGCGTTTSCAACWTPIAMSVSPTRR
jgi:hypothetical protein